MGGGDEEMQAMDPCPASPIVLIEPGAVALSCKTITHKVTPQDENQKLVGAWLALP